MGWGIQNLVGGRKYDKDVHYKKVKPVKSDEEVHYKTNWAIDKVTSPAKGATHWSFQSLFLSCFCFSW